MAESAPNKKIVVSTVTIAAILLACAAAWSLSNRKLGLKDQLQERRNVKSPIATGKTDETSAKKLDSPVPPFRFASANGGKLGLEDLKGKVWVAEFIFTSCAGYCPEMSQMTQLLQERTTDLPDLNFVSFSVDPDRDSLLALKEYAAEYKANNERWHFLRAAQKDVQALGRHGFFLLNDTDALMHSKKCALVDRNGHIRGYFDGAGAERVSDFKALEVMARELYAEKGE
ncbi:MAG: protein SCO1/2 [Planctomycetota bacterium]|jgi:protein SCO1/2